MKNKKPEPKVLFSRNRLVLTSENNLGHIEPRVQSKYSLSSTLGTNEDRYKKTKTVYTKVNRRYESPLGFYYYKKEDVCEEVFDDKVTDPTVTLQEISFITKNNIYKFKYPVGQGNLRISVETRPWNIVSGYKSMPDHFIQDLYNDLENIFAELIKDKAVVATETNYYDWMKKEYGIKILPETVGEFRNKLYLSVFGNSKGPIQQTNEEKILSHGFDLKTSFRKDKEQ